MLEWDYQQKTVISIRKLHKYQIIELLSETKRASLKNPVKQLEL